MRHNRLTGLSAIALLPFNSRAGKLSFSDSWTSIVDSVK